MLLRQVFRSLHFAIAIYGKFWLMTKNSESLSTVSAYGQVPKSQLLAKFPLKFFSMAAMVINEQKTKN